MPDSVTGNTSDSGSEDSKFEPWSGNFASLNIIQSDICKIIFCISLNYFPQLLQIFYNMPTFIAIWRWNECCMKIDARNILKGKVVDVQPGAITAKVKLDLGNGNCITSIVSLDWLEEMGIKIGDEASAIVKSTEVMLGKW